MNQSTYITLKRSTGAFGVDHMGINWPPEVHALLTDLLTALPQVDVVGLLVTRYTDFVEQRYLFRANWDAIRKELVSPGLPDDPYYKAIRELDVDHVLTGRLPTGSVRDFGPCAGWGNVVMQLDTHCVLSVSIRNYYVYGGQA